MEDDRTGTTITFLPDAEIFEEIEVTARHAPQRLRETAFLTRGLRIKLIDERADGKTVEFHYEGGIRDFVAHINEAKDPIHKRHRLLRGRERPGLRRGGDAVEQLVPGVRLLVRQQHQHRSRAARTCSGFRAR